MGMNVHPEMLILARESRELTQGELAQASGLSQANISKYEAGLLRISNQHLETIASVLGYPKSFFYQEEKRYGFGSSCTYHRKRQTLSVTHLRTLLARINLFRIHVTTLLRSVDVVSEHRFEHFDIDDFGGDVERIAQLVRNRWGLPLGPISNLVEAVEYANGIVYRCSFGTSKLDAISQWLPSAPPIFMVNADVPGDRIRFTLAHEIGHVIMHRIPTTNMEAEADRFASEFLMPAREIAADLTPATLVNYARLKPYWKVSIAALIRRARDLGKVTDRHYRSLFEELSKLGYRIAEPVMIPHEEPSVFNDLIKFHVRENGYSNEQLSEVLNLHVDELVSSYVKDERKLFLVSKMPSQHDKTNGKQERRHVK
jgi:Zn-dependent peptidase ImmA (M78 family)/DNA-binding XRE family transcriptional regulator